MKTNGEAVKWYPTFVSAMSWDGYAANVRMINTVNDEVIEQCSSKKFVEYEEYEKVFQAYKKLERKIARIKRRQNKKYFHGNSQPKFKIGEIVHPSYNHASWSEGVVVDICNVVPHLGERIYYRIVKSNYEDEVNAVVFDYSKSLKEGAK